MEMCSETYAVNLQENAHVWQLYQNNTLVLVFSWELLHFFKYHLIGIPLERLIR